MKPRNPVFRRDKGQLVSRARAWGGDRYDNFVRPPRSGRSGIILIVSAQTWTSGSLLRIDEETVGKDPDRPDRLKMVSLLVWVLFAGRGRIRLNRRFTRQLPRRGVE